MQDSARVKRVLVASAIGNALVCLLKVSGGVISGSTALLADGADSLLNVASSTLAYKFRVEAEKPPDEHHPYGHARLEAFGSLVILVLMAVTFSFICFVAVHRLTEPTSRVHPVGVAFATLSLLLNLVVSSLLKLWGRGSVLASTEARHVSLDVAEGLVTIIGVTLGAAVSPIYDVVATFVLLAMVSWFAIVTLRELGKEILDTSPPKNLLKKLEESLMSVRGVIEVHGLRARMTAGRVYADVHLVVRGDLTVEEAHKICDEAEKRVKEAFGKNVDITIHVEPATLAKKLSQLARRVKQNASGQGT